MANFTLTAGITTKTDDGQIHIDSHIIKDIRAISTDRTMTFFHTTDGKMHTYTNDKGTIEECLPDGSISTIINNVTAIRTSLTTQDLKK